MSRRLAVRALLWAALALVAAAGQAGCGAGDSSGEAQVWVTRDSGATVIEQGAVPAGLTALQGLDRIADVETGYGGGFVDSIEGIETDRLHQRDWFYYVNGYEADRGAASYRLRAGDVEWWDYRSWATRERAPIVVGAFPEPFLHGYGGKRRSVAVRYESGLEKEARALARVVDARSVAPLGTRIAHGANVLLAVASTAGKPALSASFREGERAGDPVEFVVNGKDFARRLASDPSIARFEYEVER